MRRNKIKKFSSLEKSKIVLALLREDLTLSELSSQYGASGKTIQNWHHNFLENMYLVFDPSKVVGLL
ncbi:hypothetical protein [Candidatus Cardinium hertigii]|uniref:hypothetical protein n=1 Tax=Candidatus Cardinium hertigii TaxID=247481 RepID=UPI003D7CD51B